MQIGSYTVCITMHHPSGARAALLLTMAMLTIEVRVGDVVIASTGPENRPFPVLKALDVERIAQSAASVAIEMLG